VSLCWLADTCTPDFSRRDARSSVVSAQSGAWVVKSLPSLSVPVTWPSARTTTAVTL
jgi:hypothetical protein